ncbi:MAG TPA: hypothetical protein VHX39_20670 [Acetobacteraceae bacterium]|nr:hypothetical protein [Acetobacteraceae bacterium]
MGVFLSVMAGLAVGQAWAGPLFLTITITDGLGTSQQQFNDGGTGIISLPATTIEGVSITGEFAQQIVDGTNVLISSATTITNNSGSVATTSAVVSGGGYVGPNSVVSLSGSGTWLHTAGSTITQTWYNDPTNVIGANPTNTPGNLVGTFTDTAVGLTSSFAFSPPDTLLAVPDMGLFSMTEAWNYTLAVGGSLTSRGQDEVTTVPEPFSLAVLGFGLIALGAVRSRHG